MTESTTGGVTTTEEVKTTTVTTAAGEELTTVSTSVPLVSTTEGYCREPMDGQAGLEVQQAIQGKASIDETTGAWNVPAPKTEDGEKTPKLLTQFSKRSVVKAVRLTNLADAGDVAELEPVVVSLIVSYKGPADEEFIEVPEQKTAQPVRSLYFCKSYCCADRLVLCLFSEKSAVAVRI